MKTTALILIDIQNIYFIEGKYLLDKPVEAAAKAREILDFFRKEHMPVVHVRHKFDTTNYKEDSNFLNDIYELVQPVGDEKIIDKEYPNSFFETNLQEQLDELGVENLVIAGMMSHMCVDTTVRACKDYGYNVTVIGDACTTKTLLWNGQEIDAKTVHASYMAGLNGVFAEVVSVKDYCTKK